MAAGIFIALLTMTDRQKPPPQAELNKELLEVCASPEAKNPVATVQRLLELGADVNCRADDKTLHSPLHNVAFYTGNVAVARLLLQRGAGIQAKTRRERSPLHYACGHNHLELAKLLLNHPYGASLKAEDDAGCTPFQYAFGYNDQGLFAMAQLLLEHGADACSTDNVHDKGSTVLMKACMDCSDDLVELLLKNGANANGTSACGTTPLHCTRRASTAQLLLEHGANLQAKNIHGNTPLHDVAVKTWLVDGELIAFLLKQGADSFSKNLEGNTPRDLDGEDDFAYEFMMHDLDRYNAYRRLVDDPGTYLRELMETIPELDLIDEIGAFVGVPVGDELREIRDVTSRPRKRKCPVQAMLRNYLM